MKTQNKNALWVIPTHKLHTFDLKNVCNVMPCNEINNLELVVNFVLALMEVVVFPVEMSYMHVAMSVPGLPR